MAVRQKSGNGSNRAKGTGSTTDLMPSVMGALNALWDEAAKEQDRGEEGRVIGRPHPLMKRQSHSFARLSHNVQKILANVPDEELSRNFNGDESLIRKVHEVKRNRSQQQRVSPEKNFHRSNESLDIISPNVQKMLSNLPDTELVIAHSEAVSSKSATFVHRAATRHDSDGLRSSKSASSIQSSCGGEGVGEERHASTRVFSDEGGDLVGREGSADEEEEGDDSPPRPLGSYLHKSPSGIASRSPAGRKNLGKFLQVPSESSVGTNSTASSEVSRPVSLTSLGSCSSSSSGGGPNQPGSAYLASAESLDSDPEPSGSQGSADSGIAEQPTMSPEQCVLHEVMDTENVYVADLREVIEGYLKPWQEEDNCPLSAHLQDLFSNLEEIYEFNRGFLEELKAANFDPTKTANAFIQKDSGFSIYTEYCTHYPRTMDILGELMRDEKIATLFREKQIQLGHALPLGSYLLKPVQRILKYHLLLQRLSKQCSASHKPAVDLALATMTSVATHINTMKRKHEHAVRVQEIQSQLYGWTGSDLTALGELVAEGTFRVGGARGRRHAFLFDKVLLLAKTKPDGSLAYKMHIMCSNLMLVEQVRGEPLSFHVLPFDNPRQQCTLRARSAQQKREWTLQLKRVILENYSAAIPSHARQLVMQLGQDLPDVEDNEKWSTPLKQHSAPQYLERRSRIRKTRDLSNRRAASSERSFPTLPNWRRKSEPGIINQYTTKTLPKRITRLKKVKDQSAKFYTDLSDSENCEAVGESLESLNISNESKQEVAPCEHNDHIQEIIPEDVDDTEAATNTLEKVVSDLLMQNEEFQRVLTKQKKGKESENSESWPPEETALPNKADSLPRDFQLNQTEKNESLKKDGQKLIGCLSFKMKPKGDDEELKEKMTISNLEEDSKHPEHKIYRKTAIRSSLVQRFRAMLHEEQKQKDKSKIPSYKQGSESMGARIAHPDYEEPLRLFSSTKTLNCLDVSQNSVETNIDAKVDKKETPTTHGNSQDSPKSKTSQCTRSEENLSTVKITSHNFDSYYESLMEQRLSEESIFQNRSSVEKSLYTVTEMSQKNGLTENTESKSNETESTNIADCTDIPTTKENKTADTKENTEATVLTTTENVREVKERRNPKRPTKAPPPVPSKPSRLVNSNTSITSSIEIGRNVRRVKSSISRDGLNGESVSHKSEVNFAQISSKGWVKTVVGRFE